MRILVCDDDKEICEAIAIYLKNEGYEVDNAHDGIMALNKLRENDYQLLVMDIMMPNMDGLRATMKIREIQNVPILLLSAKGEDSDKVLGLSIGADDYMVKPFNPLELIARVKSLLRRYTQLGSIASSPKTFKTGGLEINDETKEVTVDGQCIRLTAIEFGILSFLAQNIGKVFSIEQIYEKVWSESAYNSENTVTVHIRRIREKIEINPKDPKYLKVVWGIGYKLEKITH